MSVQTCAWGNSTWSKYLSARVLERKKVHKVVRMCQTSPSMLTIVTDSLFLVEDSYFKYFQFLCFPCYSYWFGFPRYTDYVHLSLDWFLIYPSVYSPQFQSCFVCSCCIFVWFSILPAFIDVLVSFCSFIKFKLLNLDLHLLSLFDHNVRTIICTLNSLHTQLCTR